MEIKDKYLSVDNCDNGDLIKFIDAGTESTIKTGDKAKNVINFTVNNGRYDLIYTPGTTALKELMKAFGRETANWVGKAFNVKIIESVAFGKPKKMIFPLPIKEEKI